MKVMILAGGSGTRLWPLSRTNYPKQFLKLKNMGTSIFQKSFERALGLVGVDDIYIVTNKDYKFLVLGEIEELGYKYKESNILVEPTAKNTLPAIIYGVDAIQKIEDDIVAVFPSDHLILDKEKFVETIKSGLEIVNEKLITYGIMPDSPNTGYGYINPGEILKTGFLVNNFCEKPNLETAKEYIENGYLWNSGIFMFRTDIFIEEVKKYSPEIYKSFEKFDNIEDIFNDIEKGISIDYGLMEKSDKVAVVPYTSDWNDLGSFDSFYEIYPQDENGNIVFNNEKIINSKNNLIYSSEDKTIAVIGIDDLIIVDEKDALLICKRDESQYVKNVVEDLKKENEKSVISHMQDYRPWGKYKILEEEENNFKIKRISVLPGKKLSYQYHHHRSEHWIIVKGMAKVTIEGKETFVRSGESIFVKSGLKHRVENAGKVLLEIIEVQLGDYLEEDDIIRLDDDYNRK